MRNKIKQKEGITRSGKVPDRKCYVSACCPIWNTAQTSPNPKGKYCIPEVENRNDFNRIQCILCTLYRVQCVSSVYPATSHEINEVIIARII